MLYPIPATPHCSRCTHCVRVIRRVGFFTPLTEETPATKHPARVRCRKGHWPRTMRSAWDVGKLLLLHRVAQECEDYDGDDPH